MPNHSDHAPFWGTYPRLKASLSRVPGTRVLYEREPQLVPSSDEGTRSYCLFFLSPTDERFEFETDTIEPDEAGIEQRFPGQGWIGCLAAISVLAPFAAVSLDQLEVYENGSRFEPDVDPHIFNLDMGKLDLESHFGEMVDEEGLSILRNLRAEIVSVLEELEIAIIPEADLDRPVPWLRAGRGALVGQAGEPITVRQAFFFRGP